MRAEEQYLKLLRNISKNGTDIFNERTGKICRVIINADLEYDDFPLVTTRKSFYKSAIAELLGYLRGYDSAAQFREIGCNTWNANANENQAWLNNPHRKGEDDMGRVYGVQGRSWQRPDGSYLDQLKKVVDNLKNGIDDRGEIITFWNPGEFELGCLRPCMHTHTFSLVGDVLHLTSYQRSMDVALGGNFNMVQCYVFLQLMARITGKKAGKIYHKVVNAHIYEDQLELVGVQLSRNIMKQPKLIIDENIKTLEDIETWVTTDNFKVVDYECHPKIDYPFSV
ncbi:thymidylate synthase [Providencia phage PSTCR6]|nr:thymidylate synthase [Providencia phage PSTCR6]